MDSKEEYRMITGLLARMGLPATYGRNEQFFSGGTMFWYRPQALQPLLECGLRFEDFPEEPIGVGGTLAHALERVPPLVCTRRGYRVRSLTCFQVPITFRNVFRTKVMKQLLHILPLWHPFLLSRILAGNASLILHMTRRQLALRYKGSILGWFWSLAQPLMMLLVYTFVFGIIFKARWGSMPESGTGSFAAAMFCGMATFNLFSETVKWRGPFRAA